MFLRKAGGDPDKVAQTMGAHDALVHALYQEGKGRRSGLNKARPKGAAANAHRGQNVRSAVEQIYRDMLSREPRWNLDRHAEYIADTLRQRMIRPSRNHDRYYTARTVKDMLTEIRKCMSE